MGKTNRFFWLAVALATIVGTFVLPLAFPPRTFLRSAAYMAGFNNSVASLAVIVISLAVTAWLVWKRLGARVSAPSTDQAMPLRWLGFASLYAAIFTSVLGAFMARSDMNHSDLFYWQMQIQQWSHHHARLYRDFEFAYGPILFYWPACLEKALGHFGIDPIVGFMLAQGTLQLLGMVILFYLLQQLPLSRRMKGIALATITFGIVTPLLGINYTMVRFGTAFAALLWISKFRSVMAQATLLFLSELLTLSISPEMGISFAGGVIAYALYRGFVAERRWLWLVPAPVAAFAVFSLLIDKNYFFTMQNFSKGLEAEIVQPFPYVLCFLFCAVVLCPLAVAGYIRRYGREAGTIVGLYVASIAMVPSAFGRCDALHVFVAWIGLFLVSLIGLDAYRGKWANVALLLALFVAAASQEFLVFGSSSMLYTVVVRGPSTGGFDLARFEQVTAGRQVYIPVTGPQFVERALEANHQLTPSYFSYTMNAESVPGIQRKLDEMHQAEFVLMPVGSMKFTTSQPMNNWIYRIFRLGLRYRKNRPFFNTGVIIADDVTTNYDPVGIFGVGEHDRYMLYKRKNQPPVNLSGEAFIARATAIGAATVTP